MRPRAATTYGTLGLVPGVPQVFHFEVGKLKFGISLTRALLATTRTADQRLGVLANGNFRKYWEAQSISFLGDQVTLISLPLVAVIALHASAAQVSFLWTALTLPILLLGLHAGSYVDRMGKRRRTMMATDLGRSIVLATIPIAYFSGDLTLAQLYIVAFAAGSLSVIFDVSNQGLMAALVPREKYLKAASLSNGSYSFSWIAGPSLGGLLVEVLSAPAAILVDVASFIWSALLLRQISSDEPTGDQESGKHIREGLRFILRTPVLLSKFAAETVVNFFYTVYFTLLFLYAVHDMHLSAGLIGLAVGSGAVGALIGSVATGRVTKLIGLGPTYALGMFVYPAALFLVPLAHGGRRLDFLLMAIAEFVSGAGLMMFGGCGTSIQQALTPDRFRSRVRGAQMSFSWGARPVGALAGGALATGLGLRPTLWLAVIGGAASILIVLPSPILRMRDLPDMADLALGRNRTCGCAVIVCARRAG